MYDEPSVPVSSSLTAVWGSGVGEGGIKAAACPCMY